MRYSRGCIKPKSDGDIDRNAITIITAPLITYMTLLDANNMYNQDIDCIPYEFIDLPVPLPNPESRSQYAHLLFETGDDDEDHPISILSDLNEMEQNWNACSAMEAGEGYEWSLGPMRLKVSRDWKRSFWLTMSFWGGSGGSGDMTWRKRRKTKGEKSNERVTLEGYVDADVRALGEGRGG